MALVLRRFLGDPAVSTLWIPSTTALATPGASPQALRIAVRTGKRLAKILGILTKDWYILQFLPAASYWGEAITVDTAADCRIATILPPTLKPSAWRSCQGGTATCNSNETCRCLGHRKICEVTYLGYTVFS